SRDWSSDVCSSDLGEAPVSPDAASPSAAAERSAVAAAATDPAASSAAGEGPAAPEASLASDGEPLLRVPGGLVDRLVDASTEAVIAVAQMHERLEELGRIRRAIRLGAQRAQDLALEADRLVDTLRRLAPPTARRPGPDAP